MTKNQIDFAKHKEEMRHNQEMEAQGRTTISENKRHNIASENVGWGNVMVGRSNVAETQRHNVSTEAINWYQSEALANLQSELAKQANTNSQFISSNIGVQRDTLKETQRHNLGMEDIYSGQNAETVRHNTAVELETNRSNLMRELQNATSQRETRRHNQAAEMIDSVIADYRGMEAKSKSFESFTRSMGNIVHMVSSLLED